MRIALFVGSLCLLACGSSIGHPCTADSDCQKGQFCLTADPGGYCTQACTTEGDTRSCPAASVCAQQASSLYCSATCSSQLNCRDAYQCNGVAGTTAKACRPVTP